MIKKQFKITDTVAIVKHIHVYKSCTKAPTKRSQHANVTYRNIVGRNMLGAFGHPVAMCCDMLGVVGPSLKMVKFKPTTPNMSQHIATRWPKRAQHVAPNNVAICCVGMLRSFAWGLRCLECI